LGEDGARDFVLLRFDVELETGDGFRRGGRREGCSGTCFFFERDERGRERARLVLREREISTPEKIPRDESREKRIKKGRPKRKISPRNRRAFGRSRTETRLSADAKSVSNVRFTPRERERPSPRSLSFSLSLSLRVLRARAFSSPPSEQKKRKSAPSNAKHKRAKLNNDAKFKRDKFLRINNLPFVNLLDKDAVNALHKVADMIFFVVCLCYKVTQAWKQR